MACNRLLFAEENTNCSQSGLASRASNDLRFEQATKPQGLPDEVWYSLVLLKEMVQMVYGSNSKEYEG